MTSQRSQSVVAFIVVHRKSQEKEVSHSFVRAVCLDPPPVLLSVSKNSHLLHSDFSMVIGDWSFKIRLMFSSSALFASCIISSPPLID